MFQLHYSYTDLYCISVCTQLHIYVYVHILYTYQFCFQAEEVRAAAALGRATSAARAGT